jgi:hypothetical protein
VSACSLFFSGWTVVLNLIRTPLTAYYFLQSGEYHRSEQERSAALPNKTESDAEFLASLVPSYLHLDCQGRVVRIDTFSKTICPGSRLGWTTCNPVFAERLERANESSTQAASGMSQALVGSLLAEQWGYTGYLRWLKGGFPFGVLPGFSVGAHGPSPSQVSRPSTGTAATRSSTICSTLAMPSSMRAPLLPLKPVLVHLRSGRGRPGKRSTKSSWAAAKSCSRSSRRSVACLVGCALSLWIRDVCG